MIAFLKGKLASSTPLHVVMDVGGVGYLVFIPHSLLDQLPGQGESVQLYTSFVVREFSHALYGFISSQERDVFEVLLNITGVGPKLALSLIGHLPLPALQQAVAVQDIPTLCRVPGVGKKTAERLLVELKDKLSHLLSFEVDEGTEAIPVNSQTRIYQDAVLALINLGYTQSIANKAVKQSLKELGDDVELAKLITVSLKYI